MKHYHDKLIVVVLWARSRRAWLGDGQQGCCLPGPSTRAEERRPLRRARPQAHRFFLKKRDPFAIIHYQTMLGNPSLHTNFSEEPILIVIIR